MCAVVEPVSADIAVVQVEPVDDFHVVGVGQCHEVRPGPAPKAVLDDFLQDVRLA